MLTLNDAKIKVEFLIGPDDACIEVTTIGDGEVVTAQCSLKQALKLAASLLEACNLAQRTPRPQEVTDDQSPF